MCFTDYIQIKDSKEVPSYPPSSLTSPDIINFPFLLPTAPPIMAPKKSSSVTTFQPIQLPTLDPAYKPSLLHLPLFLKKHSPTLRYILPTMNTLKSLDNLNHHTRPENIYTSILLPTYRSIHGSLVSTLYNAPYPLPPPPPPHTHTQITSYILSLLHYFGLNISEYILPPACNHLF